MRCKRTGQMWNRYSLVASLDEALALLAEHGERARIVAGATDLLIELERKLRPGVDTLIDISRAPGLDTIKVEQGRIHLGPLVRHNDCVASEVIQQHARPLAQACWEVGAPQIRNRGTIAGNLITASPANDTITALMALEASVTLRSLRGERTVPLCNFYTGLRRTVMAPDELMTGISFLALQNGERGMFIKLGLRKAQAISVVNVAAVLAVEPAPEGSMARPARLVLGAVAPTIVRAQAAEAILNGGRLDDATIARAAAAAADAARPIDDVRGSAGYRRNMVRVLVQRVLQALRDDRTQGWLPHKPIMLWGAGQGRREIGPEHSWRTQNGDMPASPITTSVNGRVHTVAGAGHKTLLRMLREDLQLTGTKEGCAEGECGACTVFLDGAAVMSCLVPAPSAHASEIVTIEGLSVGNRLSAVQQAFVSEGAVQCGYCTPGLVMAGAKVIEERAQPTRWEAQQAIAGNLCRCTGYYKVLSAIQRAAHAAADPAGRP